MDKRIKRIDEAAAMLLDVTALRPKVAVVLGSGLGDYADTLEAPCRVAYKDIPGMPISTVPGHKGYFVIGQRGGAPVLLMQGRFHGYEGWNGEDIALPVRVMRRMGVEQLVLTNAAGGVNTAYRPGDLVLVTDHINLSGINPLIGPNLDQIGPRFPDMTRCYDRALSQQVRLAAADIGLTLPEGVYTCMRGPSFETPAEIRMVRAIGGDLVGMSTVPEVIAAAHCGLSTAAVSCVTNMAAGILDQPLSHEEVIATGNAVKERFAQLIDALLRRLA